MARPGDDEQQPSSSAPSHGNTSATREVVDSSNSSSSNDNNSPAAQAPAADETPDEYYDRFPRHRKVVMVAVLSFCAFLAPVSSTAVLSAVPEVAAEYGTSGSVVDVSNALYMLFMGLSPIVWGPLSQVYGRRLVTLVTAALFLVCSTGTALAPNLAAFFVFRALTAFEGTAFILVGSACLSDIYRPTERATAMGWFLSGTLVGPALGPLIGGLVVTYTSWRVIFWLQTGLAAAAAVLAAALLPETMRRRGIDSLPAGRGRARAVLALVSPWRVVGLYVSYPNLVAVGVASAALVWNMYSLLTPVRYVVDGRLGLTAPAQAGLFYLAPGAGYLAGAFVGGRHADAVVRRWMRRRGGARVPEDRLRAAVPFMGLAIPACVVAYGWAVERDVGGVPLLAALLFLQGVAQLFCFPALNTYCLDVMPGRAADVVAGNYLVRYLFAAAASAAVLPALDRMGVGRFSTLSAAFLAAAAAATLATVRWGRSWRERVDRRRAARDRAAAAPVAVVAAVAVAAASAGGGEEKPKQPAEHQHTRKAGAEDSAVAVVAVAVAVPAGGSGDEKTKNQPAETQVEAQEESAPTPAGPHSQSA